MGRRLTELTRREREVLRLLLAGQSTREIAATLSVSESTAEKHIGAVLDTLGFEHRAELLAFALRERLDRFAGSGDVPPGGGAGSGCPF